MTVDALVGKRVLVMGLGLHGGGIGSARFFTEHKARVTVTDLRDEKVLAPAIKALEGMGITYVLGGHQESDFRNTDIVIKNPGVSNDSPYLAYALDSGAKILSESGIFLGNTKNFVIGVTGTKGKTTVATLINEGLRALGINSHLVSTPGGISFFDALSRFGNNNIDVSVCEFSSWDLESASYEGRSPSISIITSFFPDHLDRHKTMENYAEAKSLIFKFQDENDSLIIPLNDTACDALAHKAKANVIKAGINDMPEGTLRVGGKHNRMNAALAIRAIARAIKHPQFKQDAPISISSAEKAIQELPALSGRFEFIGERDNINGINDTTATNPGSAIFAINSVKTPIVLIAGGAEKNLPQDELAKVISRRVKYVVLMRGKGSDALIKELDKYGYTTYTRGIIEMDTAVSIAFNESLSGDTILLSPGASSLNHFANEFERGAKFEEFFLKHKA